MSVHERKCQGTSDATNEDTTDFAVFGRGSRSFQNPPCAMISAHIVNFRNLLSNELIASRTLTKRAKFAERNVVATA
jgi:hypothetical protein